LIVPSEPAFANKTGVAASIHDEQPLTIYTFLKDLSSRYQDILMSEGRAVYDAWDAIYTGEKNWFKELKRLAPVKKE